MEEKTIYTPRLFARLVDFIFVILMVSIFERIFTVIDMNLLICFWFYNAVVIVINGKTLGKFTFNISIESDLTGIKRICQLIAREILFLLLIPFLFINLVSVASTALHDRIVQTIVIRNDH